jgi:hypothetical protein
MTTPGPKPSHFAPTARFLEVLDGLLLGDGSLRHPNPDGATSFKLSQSVRHMAWVKMIEEEFRFVSVETSTAPLKAIPGGRGPAVELRTRALVELDEHFERWYPISKKVVPKDVRLTPLALAYWFSGDGARASNGYSVRFCTHGFSREDVDFLVRRLEELYGWKPEVFIDRGYPAIRMSRSGDRDGLRRLVATLVPHCFQHKLNLKVSKPCSEEEAARRRRPWVLKKEQIPEVRRRIEAGEPYAVIARDVGVNERQIGKIARGEGWLDPSVSIVRRRAKARKLSRSEHIDVLRRLRAGDNQHAIARDLGIAQPRVAWMKKRYLKS